MKNAILIAGPTASGKSALAIEHALRTGGTIVNADSMQVYDVLRVLTARPDDRDLARAPHLLYGHVDPRRAYSTGQWLRDVTALAQAGRFDAAPAIFVGGTGLYFRALLDGLSAMPEVPADIRSHWRDRLREEGAAALHAVLVRRDKETAARLRPGDGQRIVRALEVLDASGRSITQWRTGGQGALIDRASATLLLLEPDRQVLVQRIERRFAAMIASGALDEVRALYALEPHADMPAVKAIGVRELRAALAGEMPQDDAIAKATIATRQYAKRQSTWFRNQLGEEWQRLTRA